jgi:hypothetical protein
MSRPSRIPAPAPSWCAALALVLLALGCGERAERRSDAARQEESLATSSAPPPPSVRDERDFAGRGVAGGVAGRGARMDGREALQASASDLPASSAPPPPAMQPLAMQPLAPPGPSAQLDPAAGPLLIRTGRAAVEVDSLDPATAALRSLAQRLGGYVAGTSLATGRYQVRSATLELKVPSDRFEQAVGGLAPLGRVETVDVSTQDVGEEYVDVTTRAANGRRLEARLLTLLERSTGRLADVLAVERELARVREEIERAEGRLRFLRTRVTLSTLVVTVHEREPLVRSTPSENVLLEALRRAWRNFVDLLAGTIAALGVLLPVAVVGALAWRLWRRRGR